MIKLCADGTWLSVLADDVTLLVFQVVDTLNGRDDGCCATSTCLLEGLQFLFRYLPALHFHSQVDGQLHQALVGDGWQDRGTLGCDVSVILDSEEIGCSTLVDVFLLFGVQIELTAVAQVMCHLVCFQTGGIVATHLVNTCAKRCTSVIFANDDIGVCGESSFEVWAYGCHEYHEQIFCGGMNTHLSAGAYQQGTDIQGGSALVGWYEALVETYHFFHHLYELLCGKFGHEYASACTLQASSILIGAEYTHLAIGTAISLEAFECFLSVMKASGSHMQRDGLLAANLYFAPCSIAVIASYVVVCLYVTK